MTQTVRHAWHLMGHRLDWAALPVILDLLEGVDPERLVGGLVAVRDALGGR